MGVVSAPRVALWRQNQASISGGDGGGGEFFGQRGGDVVGEPV